MTRERFILTFNNNELFRRGVFSDEGIYSSRFYCLVFSSIIDL